MLGQPGAQQAPQQLLVIGSRLGGIDETLHHFDEPVRIIVEWEMPAAVEDRQPRTRHGRVCQPGVTHRYHRVLLTPNELYRNRSSLIPLDEVQRAYSTLERRHTRGKIVLTP